MTEAEWVSATDPTPMLEFLRGKASDRKLRLFAVACCLRLLDRAQVSQRAKREVQVAERYADSLASPGELEEARCYSNSTAEHACMNTTEAEGGVIMADCAAGNAAWAAAEHGAQPPDHNGLSPVFNARLIVEQSSQSKIVRCIFNPFHPISLNPSWQTSTVLALAQGIYQDRAFDRLPILADALQDASCDNPDLLNHLRSEGPHTRGCWALDLLLNRE